MNHTDVIQQLKAPFPFEAVEAKIQVTSGDKTKGMAVFYLDARAVQERLDTVLGVFGWRNEYTMWQEKSQICGLSIYNDERGEWITKYDGADNSDIEAIKGGLTDAFKRSAVLWGIGRYLYQFEGIWVEVEQRGKGFYIKANQMGLLRAAYDKAVAQIFGASANQAQVPVPAPQQVPTPIQHPSAAVVPISEYWVQSVKPSGKESQLLELMNAGGEVVAAYVKNSDNGIKAGSRLTGVNMVQKQSSYGQYNLINGYQIAA